MICIIQNIGLKLQFQSLFLINLFYTICAINSLNKMPIEAEYHIEWQICRVKNHLVLYKYKRSAVTTHFKKLFQSALNLDFENIFFQSALIWGILTHFEKKIENHILHSWLYFSFLKISNKIINLEICIDLFNCVIKDSIDCSFICHGFEELLLG